MRTLEHNADNGVHCIIAYKYLCLYYCIQVPLFVLLHTSTSPLFVFQRIPLFSQPKPCHSQDHWSSLQPNLKIVLSIRRLRTHDEKEYT